MSNPFEIYLSKISTDYRHGIATEHTYRSSLEWLLEAMAPGIKASNDPKHIECGAPDFIVERRKVPLGYVETKDIGDNLDRVEKSEQLKRYRKALHNLILTDYLEFRWYLNGELRLKTHIAEAGETQTWPLRLNPTGITLLEQIFNQFYTVEVPVITTPKELAIRLADLTRLVRDLIGSALLSNDPRVSGALERQYQTFREFLLPALKPEEFADLYAQTMAYGLFAAKLSAPEGAPFNRNAAYQYLGSNRFLRRLFMDVGEELDGTLIAPFLDDITALLVRADFASILADFGRRKRTEDPVVHFYETFLAQYDPKLRKSRGVYYTPEPVVGFIVRSVDSLIKTRFNRPWGLADEGVKILDPATGTGTFLYFVIKQVHDTLIEKGQEGTWSERSKNLLGRIFGFELLMPPYVVSHLKLGFLMRDLGTPLTYGDRLQIYLNNSLEEAVTLSKMQESLSFYIAEEANQAAKVKKQQDIMVVLGNPPYSGMSANASTDAEGNPNFIGKLLHEYYFVDGEPLGERNPKWLQDDYVKFIRFGEWRIQLTGHGVLAFITNHGYLDNPTFRGMRQHLMQSFDEIYVLDLHGNSKKKEVAPDGGKDENVFDIQQGVAIMLAIKSPDKKSKYAAVHHAHLWGLRKAKYTFLESNDIGKVGWIEIKPVAPFHLFIPQDAAKQKEYEDAWKITEIMPTNSAGIVTARDNLTIHWNSKEVLHLVQDFISLDPETARSKYQLGQDVRDWKVLMAQKDIREKGVNQSKVVPILYRPFDKRYTYYTGKTRGFICMPRSETMRHMLGGKNLGLITVRKAPPSSECNYFMVTNEIISNGVIRSDNQSIDMLFPLYIKDTPIDNDFAGNLFITHQPNFSQIFIHSLCEKIGLAFIPNHQGDLQNTFGPEDVLHYAYAIFHSPTYRWRYAEFLKIDFPRLPLTCDRKLFARLVVKGKELVDLHLLRTPKVDDLITTFPMTGDNKVEKVQYANGNVWINTIQFFGDVPEAVWDFKVGGYQVCEKWLKDRKGRILSSEDIHHYQQVVVVLKETIRLMDEIDKTIPEWPIR